MFHVGVALFDTFYYREFSGPIAKNIGDGRVNAMALRMAQRHEETSDTTFARTQARLMEEGPGTSPGGDYSDASPKNKRASRIAEDSSSEDDRSMLSSKVTLQRKRKKKHRRRYRVADDCAVEAEDDEGEGKDSDDDEDEDEYEEDGFVVTEAEEESDGGEGEDEDRPFFPPGMDPYDTSLPAILMNGPRNRSASEINEDAAREADAPPGLDDSPAPTGMYTHGNGVRARERAKRRHARLDDGSAGLGWLASGQQAHEAD